MASPPAPLIVDCDARTRETSGTAAACHQPGNQLFFGGKAGCFEAESVTDGERRTA